MVEPATPFVSGWHLDVIAEHLEAVTKGEIRNLVVNIPPRHMKSLAVSVFWPTWVWTFAPAKRWLFNSYAEGLSVRDSLKCRRLIQSPWYQHNWGHVFQLTGDQNMKTRFENDRTGYRIATSVSGGNTGEGGDFLVADDPHNVKQAESELIREGVLTWWDETMSTRGNDPKTAARVIVMQRVHERDLTGHVLEKGTYHHLSLPARFELGVEEGGVAPHTDCRFGSDPRTAEGELLWPARFGETELRAIEADLDTYGAAGQLQQRPVPRAGALFRSEWFQPLPDGFAFIRPRLNVVQYWDLAWSAQDSADFTAAVTVGIDPLTQKLYVLNVWRQRVAEQKLHEAIAERIIAHRPGVVAVEEGAYKQRATQDLIARVNVLVSEQKFSGTATAIRVTTDKVFRARIPAGRAEAGFLHADRTAPWWQAFESELLRFPKGANDDQVDALAGAVQVAIERGRPPSRQGQEMTFLGGVQPAEHDPRFPSQLVAQHMAGVAAGQD
ncbi:MAG TPA: phage terminase large subunit [Chloroflexota bacterium]|nr:phage terminase large subunit [Chloroflexota bacterium]